MQENNYKIYEYDVVRNYPEIGLLNTAKIVYTRNAGLANSVYDTFINTAIRQEFKVMAIREVLDKYVLCNEIRNLKRGIFHIQYEPDTGEIDLYSTEFLPEQMEWPVYDIPFLLFIRSKGDDMDVIFKEERTSMKYDWKDIPSAELFMQGLKSYLVNPFVVLK